MKKGPFQKRFSIFFSRLYAGLIASIGLLAAGIAASRGDWRGDFWVGLAMWALGALSFCCTLPAVQARIAAWKKAASQNWRVLAAVYAATFGLMVALLHVLFIGMGARQLQESQAWARRSITTTGRVVGFGQSSNREVVFTYQARGQSITTTGVSMGARLGQPVPVFYDPRNPQHAEIGTPQQKLNSLASEQTMMKIMPWLSAVFFFVMLLAQGVLPRPERWERE